MATTMMATTMMATTMTATNCDDQGHNLVKFCFPRLKTVWPWICCEFCDFLRVCCLVSFSRFYCCGHQDIPCARHGHCGRRGIGPLGCILFLWSVTMHVMFSDAKFSLCCPVLAADVEKCLSRREWSQDLRMSKFHCDVWDNEPRLLCRIVTKISLFHSVRRIFYSGFLK